MSHNTWIHRGVRRAVRPLVATAVTPNHITTLRLIVGLAAAGALASGDGGWHAWGAGLFLLAMLLDRADGELARLGGKSSPWGHRYDLISDALCNLLAFVGLGFGLRDVGFAGWAPAMGLAAGFGIAAILWLVLHLERQHGEGAGELGSAVGFDADDALLVLPLAVWLGHADWLLAAASVGAPLFALFMAFRFRAALRLPAG